MAQLVKNAGDMGSIPGLGRSPGEWKGYPLQYSGLENSMDCIVHGVAKSWTRLSNLHFAFMLLEICPCTLSCHKIHNQGEIAHCFGEISTKSDTEGKSLLSKIMAKSCSFLLAESW